MTQVPQDQRVRLISDDICHDDSEFFLNLLDNQAIAAYNQHQDWEEQQLLRSQVQQEFSDYLAEKVGADAVSWLHLYLQGQSQEAIAQILNLPIQSIYRLREKVAYHALRNFALKSHPDLVANWLETSLQDHHFGLTPGQWTLFCQEISPLQQTIIQERQGGQSLEAIAQKLALRNTQMNQEWTQIYLVAQALRCRDREADP
jgi:DNA-binding protein Fis